MDDVVPREVLGEAAMPGCEIGVVGDATDHPCRAEDWREQPIAHRWRQLDAALLRAVEMHRQVEPVAVIDGSLGEPLPAFYMAACVRGQREIDEHSNLERAALRERRGDRDRVAKTQLLDDRQTPSFRRRPARLLL